MSQNNESGSLTPPFKCTEALGSTPCTPLPVELIPVGRFSAIPSPTQMAELQRRGLEAYDSPDVKQFREDMQRDSDPPEIPTDQDPKPLPPTWPS